MPVSHLRSFNGTAYFASPIISLFSEMSSSSYTGSGLSIKEERIEEADISTSYKKPDIVIKEEVVVEDFNAKESEILIDIELASHENIDYSVVKLEEELIIDDSSVDNDVKPDVALISQLRASNAAQTNAEHEEDGTRKIKKIHKCPQCVYKTVRHSHIVRHVSTVHLKNKPYQCSQCDYRAANEASFRRHMILRHPFPKPYQCPDCKYQTVRKYDMKRHRLNKHSVLHSHQCKYCTFESDNFAALDRHVASNHKKDKHKTVLAKDKIYRCSNCEYKTIQLSKLKRHVLARHRHEKWMPYHCRDCNYKTATQHEMNRHAETNHRNKRMPTVVLKNDPDHLKDDFHQCSFCDYNTKVRCNMSRHVKSVHGKEKLFQCQLCEFIGKDICLLKRHMMTEHSEKKLMLNETDSDDEAPHPVVVLPSLPMPAQHHVEAISTNQKHSINHSDCINYECSHCDFKTTNSVHLNRHVKAIHTKDKPYQCSQCGFRAAEVIVLENHVTTTHLREKHYQCPDCSYKTIDVNEMNKHTTIIHPSDNLHQCQHCNYCSDDQQDLEKHVFSNHTNKKNHHISKTIVSKLAEKMNDELPHENLNEHNDDNDLETENPIKTLHQVDKLSVIGNTTILNSREKDKRGKYKMKTILSYQCSQCEYKIKNPHHLKSHVTVNHGNALDSQVKYLHEDSTLSITGYIAILKAPPKYMIHLCSQCQFQTQYAHSFIRHAAEVHLHALNAKDRIKDPNRDEKRTIKRTNILYSHKKTEPQHQKSMIHQCLKCEYKTKSVYHFTRHVRGVHTKEKPFKCSQCSFRALENSTLKKHKMLKHPLENPYDCPVCNYKAVSQYELKKHLENHKLKNLTHKCPHCNYETTVRIDLEEHISTLHAEDDSHRRQDGDIETDGLPDLENSVTVKNTNGNVENCPFCDFASAYTQSLKRHLRRFHPKKRIHECFQCEFKSSSASLLNYHVIAIHQQEYHGCDYKTANERDTKGTATNHQGVDISVPSQCKSSPVSTNDVAKPTSTAQTTNETLILKNTNCEEKRGLNDQEATTSNDTLHKCSKCNFKTAYPDSLDKHSKTCHDKARSLQCLQCQYKGPNYKLLRLHIKRAHIKTTLSKDTISNDKIIPDINKTKKDRSKINGMIVKSKSKRYHCNQCDYNTAYIHNLRRHEKAFHKSDKLFYCPMCNYKAIQLKYLQEHVVTKHV